jgi:hypothetical protein
MDHGVFFACYELTTRVVSDVKTPQISRLDRFFYISDRGSSVGREVRGGLVTFFTMAYIVVLNPLIIATAKDVDGQFIGDSVFDFLWLSEDFRHFGPVWSCPRGVRSPL